MSDTPESPLKSAIERLLRPLVKLLIRHGMPYGEFKDIARETYVDVADKEFALPGKKQSAARISVLTGINRKDVAALQKQAGEDQGFQPRHHNRVYRVTNGWLIDPDFNIAGEPKELPIDDEGNINFAELVRRYSGDVTVKALLDEMLRLGAIKISENSVRLVNKAYVPDDKDRFRIAGQAAYDLLNTLDYNLSDKDSPNRIQRMVAYDDIPLEHLEKIRQMSGQEIQQLLLRINSWLAEHDRSLSKDINGTGRVRAGVGIYYFEEALSDEVTSAEQSNENDA